jgi:hypothetical protein
MEKVGMKGRFGESELVEAPPHRAEFWFSLGACGPLPDQSRVYPILALEEGSKSAAADFDCGTREAARLRKRSKYQGGTPMARLETE